VFTYVPTRSDSTATSSTLRIKFSLLPRQVKVRRKLYRDRNASLSSDIDEEENPLRHPLLETLNSSQGEPFALVF
jgi:hypothetical protein